MSTHPAPFTFDPGRFDISVDGVPVRFLDSGPGGYYPCERRARYARTVLVQFGATVVEVCRDWMWRNTSTWRDYSPDPLEYEGDEGLAPGEPWTPEWMERAVREGVLPGLSAHQRMAWLAAARTDGVAP